MATDAPASPPSVSPDSTSFPAAAEVAHAEVTDAFVKASNEAFAADPKNKLARNVVTRVGFAEAALNRDVVARLSHTYSCKIPKEGSVTSQRASGRCWLFAAMNVFRLRLMEKYNLPTSFELSQTYLFAWDKLERCNYFLEQIIDTATDDVGSRVVQFLLSGPVGDGGQWDMIVNLVQRHGVVPKSVYPDPYSATASREMNRDLTTKLREYACELRALHAGGMPVEEIRVRKAAMLSVLHRMINIHLGEVPTTFDWSFHDKDGKHTVIRDLTPQTFYKEVVDVDISEYYSLVNDPRNEYNTLMTVDRLGNTVGGFPVRYLNVSADVMKRAARTTLESGQPVWFGCEVGKHLSRPYGVMDLDILDFEAVYSTKPTMSKKDRLLYGQSLMTHAMVFTGFDTDAEGRTSKWRVENSWGDNSGDKGYYQMTDDWFSEYCYQVVVHKDVIGPELMALLETAPTVLPCYDPMGALA